MSESRFDYGVINAVSTAPGEILRVSVPRLAIFRRVCLYYAPTIYNTAGNYCDLEFLDIGGGVILSVPALRVLATNVFMGCAQSVFNTPVNSPQSIFTVYFDPDNTGSVWLNPMALVIEAAAVRLVTNIPATVTRAFLGVFSSTAAQVA